MAKKKFMHGIKVMKIALAGKSANLRKFPIFKSVDYKGKGTEEENVNMNPLEFIKEKLNDIFDDEELKKAMAGEADAESVAKAKAEADKKAEVIAKAKAEAEADEKAKAKAEADKQKAPALPTEVTEMFKTQQATIETLQKSLDEQISFRKKLEATQETEKIQRVVKGLSYVPADEDELTAILKTLKDSDEDQYKKAISILRKMDKVVASGAIFDSIGTPSSRLTKSVLGELDQKVVAIRKSNPDMSEEDVLMKAYEENPDLYEESRIATIGAATIGDNEEV